MQLLIKALNKCEKGAKTSLLFLVAIYRTALSQHFGGQCRFYPSCSHYAVDSLKEHSLGKALQLIVIRILRCHPWGSSGWDPVPPAKGDK